MTIKFQKMAKKLKMFVPEESCVGILLKNVKNYKVVKSKNKGIMQHDLTSWECFGQFLVDGKLSKISTAFQKKINNLIKKTDIEDRKIICDTFFNIIDDNGITEISELKKLNLEQIISILSETININFETKKILFETIKVLSSK